MSTKREEMEELNPKQNKKESSAYRRWMPFLLFIAFCFADCSVQITQEPLRESRANDSIQREIQRENVSQEPGSDTTSKEPGQRDKEPNQHTDREQRAQAEVGQDQKEPPRTTDNQEHQRDQDSLPEDIEPPTRPDEPIGNTDARERSVEPTEPDLSADGGSLEEPITEPIQPEPPIQEEPISEPPAPETSGYCYTGIQRECPLTGVGDCGKGIQTCVQRRWTACASAGMSSPEICDGRDNDCDGQVDEVFAKTTCCVPTTELFHSQRAQSLFYWPSSAISPDGKEMALVDQQSRRLQIIDPQSGKNIRTPSTGDWTSRIPRPVVYHPTKHWIAVGGRGKTATQEAITLIDAKASTVIRTFKGRSMDPQNKSYPTDSEAVKVRFSPDGSLITALFDGSTQISHNVTRKQVVVWQTSTGSIVQTINAQQIMLSDVAFSHDNKLMATGTIYDQIKLWRLSDGALLYTLDPTYKKMNKVPANHMSMDFHPKQDKLLVVSPNAQIRVWNTKTGKLEKQMVFPGGSTTQNNPQTQFFIKYDRQGQWFLVAPKVVDAFISSFYQGFYLIDASTYKTLHTFGYSHPRYNFHGFHWSLDNKSFTVLESIDAWRFGCTR